MKEISISINRHAGGVGESNAYCHCGCIALSGSKELNTTVSIICHIQIQLARDEDSGRRVEHVSVWSRSTRSSHDGQCARWMDQRCPDHLMLVLLRTVEIVAEIDEETVAWWTTKGRDHRRWELCAVQHPSLHATTCIRTTTNEDLIVACDEQTRCRWQTSRNQFSLDSQTQGPRCGCLQYLLIGGRRAAVVCIDENGWRVGPQMLLLEVNVVAFGFHDAL